MKKRILAFTIIFFCFTLNAFSYSVNVYDDANLFTSEEEQTIINESDLFSLKTDFSLAVVTTDFTSGVPSEEYADDFLDNLIDTEGWQENSLLFLIDMDNRNVRISTSGDCQLAFDDSEIESIIDSGYNELVDGLYCESIVNMINHAGFVDTEINQNDFYIIDDESLFENEEFDENIIQFEGDYYAQNSFGEWEVIDNYNSSHQKPKSFSFSDFLGYAVIGLIIGAVCVFIISRNYKNIGKGDEFSAQDINLNLTASNDSIISRNVITTKIPRNNNSHKGGGSFGGGSTVHRSSGGRSHGGGGRSF